MRRDGALQGNCQRTKKGESSGLLKNGHLTGTVEHCHQPQYQPEQRHGREDTGRGAQGEDGQAKDPATNNALRTAKLSVGLRSTRGKEGERSSEKTLDPSAIREDGTDEGAQGVVVRGLYSRLELQGRREAKERQEIHQR